MATITKLKSGNYRIRKQIDGKTYATTLDYKPKQREADKILFDMVDNDTRISARMRFEDAAKQFLSINSNILSPSTIREYSRMLKTMPAPFLRTPVADIDADQVQAYINAFTVGKSPKTVCNRYGFISTVMKYARPKLRLDIKLPPKKKAQFYVPEDEDVEKLLKAIEGHECEIPILLGAFGLRRSEICALTLNDIKGCDIYIHKAKVRNERGEWIVKDRNKTADSERTVTVPQAIIDKINEKGYVYKGAPGTISRYMKRIESRLGLETFTLHKLRHYFASTASALGIPEAYIKEMGGWHTGDIMQKVYQHQQKRAAEENRKSYAAYMEKVQNS